MEDAGSPPCWALALCWKDVPRPVNETTPNGTASQRFEALCRSKNVPCLIDCLDLPPSGGIKRFFKPVPRVQEHFTSVWPDEQALRVALMDRPAADQPGTMLAEYIARMDHVLFWIPGRGIPTITQFEKCLARKQVLGDSPIVGDLSRFPSVPLEPSGEFETEFASHPQAREIRLQDERLGANQFYADLQYDRRVFRTLANSANGDVQPGLVFHYHEEAGSLWAFYEGEGVHLGSLVARKSANGRLNMCYQHVNAADELRAGRCLSFPELLPDGRLRMKEYWQWSTGDQSAGVSQIEEEWNGVNTSEKSWGMVE